MTGPPNLAEIEHASTRAWPPAETAFVAGWLLRAAHGHTNRANSVQTLAFDGSLPIVQAVAACEDWYHKRGLPGCFKLCDRFQPVELDEFLDMRGYPLITPSAVHIHGLDGIEEDDPQVVLEGRPTQAVSNVICHGMSSRGRTLRTKLFARIKRPHVFAVLFDHGLPAASGLAVLDDAWGSISGMMVLPAMRGRGFGRRVVRRLLQWLGHMGAQRVFLQVEKDNAPALALYRRVGFKEIYHYHYRVRSTATGFAPSS